MAGRKRTLADGKKLPIWYTHDQDEEIDRLRELVRVTGVRGRPRPMTKNEFFREGARLLARELSKGRFKAPRDRGERAPHEAEIVDVLLP